MRKWEWKRIGKSECGSGNGKELRSRNAEVGMEKNWEVGMRKWEWKRIEKSECGSGNGKELGSRNAEKEIWEAEFIDQG